MGELPVIRVFDEVLIGRSTYVIATTFYDRGRQLQYGVYRKTDTKRNALTFSHKYLQEKAKKVARFKIEIYPEMKEEPL